MGVILQFLVVEREVYVGVVAVVVVWTSHFYVDNSNLLKLPEFFRIIMPNILYETLAWGDALKLPPRYFPLATTSIVILGCFHAQHLEISNYFDKVAMSRLHETVNNTSRLCLIFFDLS